MALSGCSSGLLFTTLVAVLLLPAHYFVPELYSGLEEAGLPAPPAPPPTSSWLDTFNHLPPFDLFFTFTLFVLAFVTYTCEWIQRKIMERRIVKLNKYLGASVERLRQWDKQQEQLESTFKFVRDANCEYNLLLCLLLRRPPAPPNCCYDKDYYDDISFLHSTADASVS